MTSRRRFGGSSSIETPIIVWSPAVGHHVAQCHASFEAAHLRQVGDQWFVERARAVFDQPRDKHSEQRLDRAVHAKDMVGCHARAETVVTQRHVEETLAADVDDNLRATREQPFVELVRQPVARASEPAHVSAVSLAKCSSASVHTGFDHNSPMTASAKPCPPVASSAA